MVRQTRNGERAVSVDLLATLATVVLPIVLGTLVLIVILRFAFRR